MFSALITALGESDCETIGQGFLAQPVNAVSSLAYVVLGIYMLASLGRHGKQERQGRVIFATVLIATGVGSVMYHGTQGPFSGFVHDMSFLSALLFLAVMNLGGIMGASERLRVKSFFAFGFLVAAVLLVWPTGTNALAGIVVVVVVVSDVVGHRRGTMQLRWWAAAVGTMLVAVVFFGVGRTGGIVCDSSSVFQAHAGWHILSAVALWAYFEATTAARKP